MAINVILVDVFAQVWHLLMRCPWWSCHLHDRRPGLGTRWVWGAGLAHSKNLKGYMTLQKQNRVLWHRDKEVERMWSWKERAVGDLQSQRFGGPNANHKSRPFSCPGKSLNLQPPGSAHKQMFAQKHNNNCLKERCSNLHGTLSSR